MYAIGNLWTRTGMIRCTTRHNSVNTVSMGGKISKGSAMTRDARACRSELRQINTVSDEALKGKAKTSRSCMADIERSSSNKSTPPGATFPPPPLSRISPLWTDEVWSSPIDIRHRIFCNRSLNMKSIKAVGWDMDHTLAQYDAEAFESLAYECTIDKMVKHFGYPKILYDLKFDHTYMTRGLVIDKARGNMLKVDRHQYVKLATHGFQEISRDERMSTYNVVGQLHEFDEPKYALIDTLFSLAEAYLFMQLVEIADENPGVLPEGKRYDDLYRDVRAGVDLAHRDGTIKRQVAKDPSLYIHEDPGVVAVLDALRQSGKKIFLATNSLWDYTDVVMNYLIDGKIGADRDHEWLRHFDVVVTGCGKPRFFTDRKDLFEVHPDSGMLWNTEGGSPMVPIGDADLPTPLLGSTAPENLCEGHEKCAGQPSNERARVFQGGSYLDLHKMLGVKAASEILYVGDHIYGDVVRSKKDLGWRTMLVIPELASELEALADCKSNMVELKVLRRQRDNLEDQIQRLEWKLANANFSGVANDSYLKNKKLQVEADDLARDADEADNECEAGAAVVMESDSLVLQELQLQSQETDRSPATTSGSFDDDDDDSLVEMLQNLRDQRNALATRHRTLLKQHHESFHPVWGQVFKTGYQSSRYAHQVERFACLYTSHVSNLMLHSPFKSYKGRVDTMAHEDEAGIGCEIE